MHLTHSANNLFAEVFLAASATVRRQQQGAEITSSIPLIDCAQYGDPARNSDPNIGIAVANPVGLYMASFDGSGLSLNGNPAGGFFTVVRGQFPLALRAVYQLPPDLAASGLTVSDVKIGGKNIEFGGELAERITMHLIGAASVAQTVHNTPAPCGPIQQADTSSAPTAEQEADGVPDEAFKEGLPARAGVLGDAPPPGKSDPTAGWVMGGSGNVPDILLIVASDDLDELAKAVARLRPAGTDGPGAPQIIWQEKGQTRTDLPGHEHFGFKDGLSQPGVRGRVSASASGVLTPRLLAASPLPDMEFAAPGQPLVWPGEFVFGYPFGDKSTGAPVTPPPLNPPWLKNGSLLVFRRLRHDVAGFNQFLRATAAQLTQAPDFAGMTADRLGALIVGRWPSGAPIMRAPTADNPVLGQCPLANNDFLYAVDTPPPELKPQQPPASLSFPTASEDADGFICPHAAHIRKVNPRDQDSDKGTKFDT